MTMPTGFNSYADWLPFLAELAAKATVLLLLTAVVAALLWRSSAATRHLVWCMGIVGVLALPLFSAFLPTWELPLLPAREAAAPPASAFPADVPGLSVEPSTLSAAPAPATILPAEPAATWLPRAAAGLVLAGVAAGLLWLAVGFVGVARLGRRAEVVRDPAWLRSSTEAAEQLGLRRPVLLLRTRGSVMPATGGLLWPVIVVPDVAEQWTDDRRRAVLAHELAHVKRFDCLTQALAQVACALFWWHPAVWYAARRLRVERERACDDLVLGAGTRASDYAAHLLEIARSHRGLRLATPALVSMARPSHLESRLLWVLDAARARGVPSARATVLSVAVALLAVGSLSAMRPISAAGASPSPDEAGVPAYASAEDEKKHGAHGKKQDLGAAVDVEADAEASVRGTAAGDTFPEVQDLIDMAAVGVDAAYIAEMRAAGFDRPTPQELISARATGVTGAYVAEMSRAGLGRLSLTQLSGMAAMDVTPAYLAELRGLGFGDLTAERVTEMRAMGVDRAFVQTMAGAGFRDLSPEQLSAMAAMDVTPEYIRQMQGAGLGQLDVEELTGLRAMDVTPAYIRELASVGLTGLSVEQVTALAAHEVTAEWVREIRAAGFASTLTADQLVRLKTSGVDRELIQSRRAP
jgi:beta-lactamase regulating signal transducer with metallopeptidase domain